MDSDGSTEPKERWRQNSVCDPGVGFGLEEKKPVKKITVDINEIMIL